LLPSPNITVVHRGWKTEELYGNMFAVSAVEVHESMSEDNIRQTFNKIFGKKVVGLSDPKFNFVRAVGNKIIDPGCQSYDGKVIKYLSKQGPIYIRATQKIESGLQLTRENEQTSEENNSDNDDGEDQPAAPSQTEGDASLDINNAFESDNTDDEVLFVPAFGYNEDPPLPRNESISAVMVSCPTCSMSLSMSLQMLLKDSCKAK
jgi:hypothetical protein